MKERKTKIIVTLMTVAVIGLISVQLYWLINVIKVEEERFERKANDALLLTAYRIDRAEATTSVMKKIYNHETKHNKREKDFYKATKKDIGIIAGKKVLLERSDSSSKPGLAFQIIYDSSSKNESSHVNIFHVGNSHDSMEISSNIKWKERIDSFVAKRSEVVEDVLTDIIRINISKKLEERISNKQIDSILKSELGNKGIKTDYYFGIRKGKSNSFVLVKEGSDTSKLRSSNYKAPLFPDEIFNQPTQLLIYFPNKNSYLLSTVWWMLSLSIGLIVLVAGVFYKTLQLFIQQKKITEIKNDFINNITHEFKTPISTISLACEALNEKDLVIQNNSVEKYSAIIKEENDRLKMMVETLLNTAAIEKGSYNLSYEQVDVNAAIKNGAEKFEEIVNKKSGKIEFAFSVQNPIIKTDRFHFMNIISNLIDNAVKYNENPPIISISTSVVDDKVIIAIKDNGFGIAKEHLEKIFETFYRIPTGNIHNVRGNGIGLSYAKQIVESFGGKINVRSKLNEGSLFEIILPKLENEKS